MIFVNKKLLFLTNNIYVLSFYQVFSNELFCILKYSIRKDDFRDITKIINIDVGKRKSKWYSVSLNWNRRIPIRIICYSLRNTFTARLVFSSVTLSMIILNKNFSVFGWHSQFPPDLAKVVRQDLLHFSIIV